MGLLENKVNEIRSKNKSEQSLLDRTISDIRGDTTTISQPTIQKKESKLKEFFKPELGVFETILSPFFVKETNRQIQREEDSRTKLLNLYKTLPDNEQKARIRKSLTKDKILNFNDIIKTADKTTSQVLGEAITTALWITPIPEIKTLIKPGGKLLTKLAKSSLRGSIFGVGYGGAYGLAEEGTLKEKKGDIAENMIFGAIGGFLFDPVLTVALPGAIRGIAKILKKVLTTENNQIIKPIVRYIERPVGKVKTTVALKEPKIFNKEISKLEEKISNSHSALDNFVMGQTTKETYQTAKGFPKPSAKAGTAEDDFMKKQVERINKLRKELLKIEKQKESLLNKSAEKNLKTGDEIFSKESGRLVIDSFMTDNSGKLVILSKDTNGRLVYVEPDMLLSMKKIIKPEFKLQTELVNIAKPLEIPIEKGKVQKVNDIMVSALRSGGVALKKMGEGGQQIELLMAKVIGDSARKVGGLSKILSTTIRKLGLDKSKTKFTNEEVKNIIDILDSGLRLKVENITDIPTKPINKRVKEFLETFSNITKALINEADEIGLTIRNKTTGKKRPIGDAKIHFPHIIKDIEKFNKNRNELLGIMQKRQGLSKKQANALLNLFVENYTNNRYAGIEKSRTFLIEGFDELEKFGFETNPIIALQDFINGSSKRITEAKNFGKENELLKELMNVIRESGYDESMAQSIWNAYNGLKGTPSIQKSISQALRTVQIIFKLPFGALLNATQSTNTAAEFGVRNTVKTFKEFVLRNEKMRDRAVMAGVTEDVVSRAIKIAGGESKLVESYLRKVGFTFVETFNRIIAVGASQEWAIKSLNKLLIDKNNPKLIRHFKNLGIKDINKVLDRNRFTQEELNIIGQKAVNSTQFRNSVLDIPLLWNSPEGKVITQFKSFSFQQAQFIKRVIVDELAEGNMAPLITYLIVSQFAGEGVKDIKSILKGDTDFREDLSVLERLIDNQMTVGGFGLTGDLFNRLFVRAEKPFINVGTEFIAGPTGSDIGTILNGIGDLFGGRIRSGILNILNTIPNLSALLRNLTK